MVGLPAVALDVDEFVGAQVEHALARAGAAGSDDVRAGPAGERHRHRSDSAAGAVNDHRLAGLEMAVVEQRLPRRERGLRDGRGFDEVDCRRLRRQAAHLDGHELGGPAVAVAVDEPEHLVADRHAGGAVAERDHDARSLVRRDAPASVMSGAVGRQRPHQLGRGEAGGAHLHERVADRRPGIGGVLVDEAVNALEALRFHKRTAFIEVSFRVRGEYPNDEWHFAESTVRFGEQWSTRQRVDTNGCGVNARASVRLDTGSGLGYSTEATGGLRREIDLMTMYLPNRDIRPTGAEAGEFLDLPAFVPPAEPNPRPPEVDDEADETSAP